MKPLLFPSLLAALFVVGATQVRAAVIIFPEDSGFESPDLGSTPKTVFSYRNTGYDIQDSGWTFAPTDSSVGITTNGSAYLGTTVATNGNSDGTTSALGQAAIIGDAAGNEFYQTLTLSAGTYTVDFDSAGRNFGGPAGLPVEVGISAPDGSDFVDLGTYAPASNSVFTGVISDSFTVTTGDYRLTFENGAANGPAADQGYYGNDNVFIDNVSLVGNLAAGTPTVPEPSTWVLSLFGMGALFFGLRRRLR